MPVGSGPWKRITPGTCHRGRRPQRLDQASEAGFVSRKALRMAEPERVIWGDARRSSEQIDKGLDVDYYSYKNPHCGVIHENHPDDP